MKQDISTVPHLDETAEKIEAYRKPKDFPETELVDENNRPITQNLLKFKQSKFIALVATMPILAGLIAALVLVKQEHDFRRKAFEQLVLNAESACIDGQAKIQVSALSRVGEVEIRVIDIKTQKMVDFGKVEENLEKTLYISSNTTSLKDGSVTFVVKVENQQIEQDVSYSAITCE